MKRRARTYYSEAQKALMWDRWQRGDTLRDIARGFDCGHSSIQHVLSRTGGIRPRQRVRSSRALSLAEREEISRGVVAGCSMRSIAARLGRAPSTVSRELRRHGGCPIYRASNADEVAGYRARRPKLCKLVQHRPLARIVARKLKQWWSPEQIAGWLKRAYPTDETYHVSHETLYRCLFIQARGALKKELLQHLRRSRTLRHSRYSQKVDGHGRISGTIPISERPPSVEDRAVPGHWEGDLLCGTQHSQIVTLVERHTRYVMLIKAQRKDTQTVIDALIHHAQQLPKELYASLTWDRGKEMADHARFTVATDIQVYFCDPQQPWQRGSNENTNGLLRQYFPQGTDVSGYTQRQLDTVARQLNERPRKTLHYDTPAQRFNHCVASIG